MGANIIPSNEPSPLEIVNSLSTLEKQAIIRPNNPPAGISGFLFDIVQEDGIELNSAITDHYVEDNTAIQDQIALRPERLTIRGLIAELATLKPATKPVAPTTNPLPLNAALVPPLTPGALATEESEGAASISSAAAVVSQQSLYGYFNSQSAQQPNQTKQTKAFLFFYALWKGRQLCSVETPWGIMTDMAVEVFRAEQDETTRFSSDFRATFKKMRFAGTITANAGQLAGRAALQTAPVTNNGNAGQTPKTATERSSILYKLAHP